MLPEPSLMSFELTRGDVYCCNNELHCTQCNNCNQTMSVGLLKCRTYQETLSRQSFTTMSPTTNNPQTVDGECQYSVNPTVISCIFPTTTPATTMISSFIQTCDGEPIQSKSMQLSLYATLSGTVITVLGATVGVLLVLLLVTVVALVNTCVALRLKNKQRYVWHPLYNSNTP